MTSELEIKLTDLSSQERKLKRELKQLENDKYKLIQTIHLQNDQQKEKEKSAQTLKDIENIHLLDVDSEWRICSYDLDLCDSMNLDYTSKNSFLASWLWKMIDEYFQTAPKLNILSCPPDCELFDYSHTHYSCSVLEGNYIYTCYTEQTPDLFCDTPKYQQLHRKVSDTCRRFSEYNQPQLAPYLYEIFKGGSYRVIAQRLFDGNSEWHSVYIKKLK